ncbi:YIP1 family protein [Prolixibacter denitrificans]|uniref:Yip1 domain-containing protein n=1 Tax=Prolixibacter denitrificans TaxID=1541063 RepID=A0A2P8C6P2_9BACT|nr:YIP1 family protein [Prolixibacter denitrificans]PSK80597.1 hypothetical protein CLV93_11434 [Prolixibacter denitrificans]GET22108.1 hypothetical protein JCM18694_23540 [Prolixibacter denitrificans]
MNKFFNPFRYIAGGKSLLAGLLILFLTAVTGYFSHTHFPDLISIKLSPAFPLWYFVVQVFTNWLVISIVLYGLALIFSSSSVRIIDIFGTQALARFPYFLAAVTGFFSAMSKFGRYILYTRFHQGEPVDLTSTDVILVVFLMMLSLFLSIWTIILMYNAFRISANVKGGKAVALFITAFIISMVATLFLSRYYLSLVAG